MSGAVPKRGLGGSAVVVGVDAANENALVLPFVVTSGAAPFTTALAASVVPKILIAFGASAFASLSFPWVVVFPNPLNSGAAGVDSAAFSVSTEGAETVIAGGGLLFSVGLSAGLPKENAAELVDEGTDVAANENGTPLEAEGWDVGGNENKGAATGGWGVDFGGSLAFSLLPSQKGLSLSLAGASLAPGLEAAMLEPKKFGIPLVPSFLSDEDDAFDPNDKGGVAGKLRDLEARVELAKKFGTAGEAVLLLNSGTLTSGSFESRVVPSGGASANERKGFGAPEDPSMTSSEFSLREIDVSNLLDSDLLDSKGLPNEKGRFEIGGSLAFVRSFCSGVASGLAKEKLDGSWKVGNFLEASSIIACSLRLPSSSPSIASSPSSSYTAENLSRVRETVGRAVWFRDCLILPTRREEVLGSSGVPAEATANQSDLEGGAGLSCTAGRNSGFGSTTVSGTSSTSKSSSCFRRARSFFMPPSPA